MPRFRHKQTRTEIEAVRIDAVVWVLRDGGQACFVPGDWFTIQRQERERRPPIHGFLHDAVMRENFEPWDMEAHQLWDQPYNTLYAEERANPPMPEPPQLSSGDERTRSIQLT